VSGRRRPLGAAGCRAAAAFVHPAGQPSGSGWTTICGEGEHPRGITSRRTSLVVVGRRCPSLPICDALPAPGVGRGPDTTDRRRVGGADE